MSDQVMRSHIKLYVNEFSDDLGRDGRVAVHALFARAHDARVLHRQVEPVFAY
jgi:1,4-dihydroxy-6-naphthoate synthase